MSERVSDERVRRLIAVAEQRFDIGTGGYYEDIASCLHELTRLRQIERLARSLTDHDAYLATKGESKTLEDLAGLKERIEALRVTLGSGEKVP